MRGIIIWAAGVLFVLSSFVAAGTVLAEDVMVDGGRRGQKKGGFGAGLFSWGGRGRGGFPPGGV
ncbi:MAG: hypothetical protein H8D56_25290 [Planctomycetes bacterium]|nr:hypothetical protein [Planctomycetota bacterium]